MTLTEREPPRIVDGPEHAEATLILAHGAGAVMDSEFMSAFAEGLAERKLRVVRFEFPYMAERRLTGKLRPPDREAILRRTWLDVLASLSGAAPFIGGKSMGGRIASLIADEVGARGLICLGYPFHPPGRPGQTRIGHLQAIRTPTLIVQGERDPFGSASEVAGYALSGEVRVHWLADGDHGFTPRASSRRSREENWHEALEAIVHFVRRSER
ncbi:alpha/beta family hydrolase [Accumulibacter sp.]|uniref:alpha/beta family hydrolase n=1 Tax=Accumulibacter sp. TaxID=2053492 RepID=UPI0025CFD706|nr:alpha/beta family hydrolase [Accumulibacter sp.]MCM8596152.1 dienelactone hydrolase family protein [Accumulibacter sp.]MCM8625586.1 dienelactone hydrolase family protein [Accumulibacter sp.]MDS4050301.1 dienelactone hydrolase family protein [Accumulibacter sp.]